MNFLKNIKNIKKFLKPSYLLEVLSHFFGRYARAFVFLIAIALVGFCINLWRTTLYQAQWNAGQKAEYIKNKGQGTTFNEKGFEYDTAAAKARDDESKKDIGNLTDIFRLEKAAPTPTPVDKAATAKPATVSMIQVVPSIGATAAAPVH